MQVNVHVQRCPVLRPCMHVTYVPSDWSSLSYSNVCNAVIEGVVHSRKSRIKDAGADTGKIETQADKSK